MNDTTKFIQQKQFEIIMSKPLKERLAGIFEMTDLSRKIIRNRLNIKNPDITEVDLKIELFKTFYRFDFDNNSLIKIAESMKRFWNLKKKINA